MKFFLAFLFSLLSPWLFCANVLLISIDTLRSDHLGCYGYSKPTPAIDALAKKAVLFENVISQVPMTLPSHCTILTGLYPDQHGVRNNENFVLPAKIQTLAETFRANGYATGAVVGSFSLDSRFGLNQGFQFYEDQIGKSHDPEVSRNVERRAEKVWQIGKKWLDSQKEPWFCFLHFFDPHTGYNPPAPYPHTYDGEIAYVDHVIGEITEDLQQTNRASTTLLVILSDHGEGLGEHGEASHGVFLYDSTLKVPLLMVAPWLKPQRINSQVRLVDVAPTIAELEHLKSLPTFSGQSLVSVMNGKNADLSAYSETYYTNLLMGWAPLHAVRMRQHKWIEAPKPEFYDLTKDPHELKNLYTPNSIPHEYLAELQKHEKNQAMAQAKPVDPEVQEKLSSLGYVTGGSAKSTSSSFDPKDGIVVWTDIETAVQYAQTGELEKSKKLFQSVLQKQPDNVIAQKFYAAVLIKKGETDEAIRLLKSALKSNLHQTDTRVNLASIYFDQKQYQEVIPLLQPVLQNESENWRAWKMTAISNSMLGHDRDALNAFEHLAAIRPLNEEESLEVAGIFLTQEDIPAAEKYFRMAVTSNPDSARGWKGLALIAASRQQWFDAAQAFVKAGDCKNASDILSKIKTPPASVLQTYHQKCG